MNATLVAALLLLQAGSSAPHKLLVFWAQGGAVVIDYPSAERCERARLAVEREGQRRIQASRDNAPPGAIVGAPWIAYAFCVPA